LSGLGPRELLALFAELQDARMKDAAEFPEGFFSLRSQQSARPGPHEAAVLRRSRAGKLNRQVNRHIRSLSPTRDPLVFLNAGVATVDELTFEIVIEEGPRAAHVTSVVTGTAALPLQGAEALGVIQLTPIGGAIPLAEGLESAITTTRAVRSTAETASLAGRLPGVTSTGELNLLNVARRGVPLTSEELAIAMRAPVVDTAPAATQFFKTRIMGDFLKFGRFRGRFGNVATRITTLNELTLIELRGLQPEVEFFVRGLGPGNRGSVFPDIAVFDELGRHVEFIQVIKTPIAARELRALSLINQAFPDVPVRFVISGPR